MPREVRSLLIVDDSPGDRYIAQYVLGKSGRFKHIYAVHDGREALDLFVNYQASLLAHPERFPPMVVLLDVNMPRMTGFEFLDALESLGLPGVPVVIVMLTSSQALADAVRADRNPQVSGYVVKPITQADAVHIADTHGEFSRSPDGTGEDGPGPDGSDGSADKGA